MSYYEAYKVDEVPTRIRFYHHPRVGRDLMGQEVKHPSVLFTSREEVLQKIGEVGGTLEEMIVQHGCFIVRDRGGHVVPGGDDLTRQQAADLAVKLNQEECEEKTAQEQRITEHKAQKAERERRTTEAIANRKRIDTAGVYATNIRLKLENARSSEETIQRLIDQWQSDLLTKQAELDAVKLSIKTYETEIRRILANAKGESR